MNYQKFDLKVVGCHCFEFANYFMNYVQIVTKTWELLGQLEQIRVIFILNFLTVSLLTANPLFHKFKIFEGVLGYFSYSKHCCFTNSNSLL